MEIVDLKPGDVLLYSSRSWIGKLIRKLDGTDVTHAGIFLGDGHVGEALMVGNAGINANPINDSFAGSDWIEARRLHDVNLDTSHITRVAKKYIAEGNRYAYAEIVLLAVILMTRKLDLHDSKLGRIAWVVFRKVNNWIESVFDQGREPMICSEFAFRCYDEADPAEEDSYTLEILSQAGRSRRRRFSRRRRRDRIFRDSPEIEMPTIAPESLIAESLAEPQVFAAAPAIPAEPEIPDVVLDDMIADYLGEDDIHKDVVYGAPATPVIPEPTKQDLEREAANLAFKLASPARLIFNAAPYASAATEDRVKAAFADFVTPGDLFKSPSLRNAGRISY